MTEELKEIIYAATIKRTGFFDKLMFISNGNFVVFPKKEYDYILILGWEGKSKKWYRVSENGDKFDIFTTKMAFNLDIPTEYGVPCIWFDKPIYIDNSLEVSNVVGEFKLRDQE